MTIKSVFFDIDGTLVDSNDLHVLAWQEAFRRMGVELRRDVIHDQIGKGGDKLIPALLPDADEAKRQAIDHAHGEIYKEKYLPKVRPFPKARELLVRVRDAGQRVLLASSASTSEVDFYLDLLDARALVTDVTSADDVAQSKPAPDIFACALTKVAPLTASEVMVVGDTPYDVEAARKCRIATIGVRSGGFADESLLDAGAAALYDDVEALLRDYSQSPLGN
jgi:HAD superfamily hydrolase (TIGR01509 family)